MDSVTALYAGITTLLFAGLSVNVSRLRGKYKTALGDNSEPEVLRAVRAQGNCAEYLAILFVMLLLAELMRGDDTILHMFGGGIFLARVLHAYGVIAKMGNATLAGATLNYIILTGLPIYVLYLRFA